MGADEVQGPQKPEIPDWATVGDGGWLYDAEGNMVGHESVGISKQVQESWDKAAADTPDAPEPAAAAPAGARL